MLKDIIALIVMAILPLAVSGCSGNSSSSGNESPSKKPIRNSGISHSPEAVHPKTGDSPRAKEILAAYQSAVESNDDITMRIKQTSIEDELVGIGSDAVNPLKERLAKWKVEYGNAIDQVAIFGNESARAAMRKAKMKLSFVEKVLRRLKD